MRDVRGDLWTYPAEARAITTNGVVGWDGAAIMGRGCAREAVERCPAVATELGDLLLVHGNHVHRLGTFPTPLFSFPTKAHWRDKSIEGLIVQSAIELARAVTAAGFASVVIPRPGCGNGGLHYDTQVRPLLVDVWDDRFRVITP